MLWVDTSGADAYVTSFTGLNATQSQTLIDKYHIYLTSNGRISMAGLNTKNVRYVAESIDKVVRGEAKL